MRKTIELYMKYFRKDTTTFGNINFTYNIMWNKGSNFKVIFRNDDSFESALLIAILWFDRY